MKPYVRALIGLAAGCALLSSATYAAAQDHPAGAPNPAMMEKWKAHRHEREEAHIRDLHDLLNIRADQEPAFHAFVDSMKPPEQADHMRKPGEPGAMEHLTTPQLLDHLSAHLAARQHHIEATRTFYAALNPEQQRAFDVVARKMFSEHMGGHGMGGHGGPGHPGGPHGDWGPKAE